MKYCSMLVLICLLTGCSSPGSPSPTAASLPTPVLIRTARPTISPYPAPTRAATITPLPTATTASTATPDPLASYTIAALRFRSYGGGEVQDAGIFSQNDTFARHSIIYPSDGLNIYGFMNIPLSKGTYPVIIAIHGYVDPAQYDTLDYTTGAADDLASSGYIIIHPNLRNFRPSDSGDALFRVGYAIDVLNLIALIRENAGKPGLFEQADAGHIGIWSHSMGGDVALKVAVISREVQAIFLYAPLSGDEQKNSQFFNFLTGSSDNQKEMLASPIDFAAISPSTYYPDITAAIQIHHGTGDSVIPVTWSEQTCQQLTKAGRDVQCYFYDGAQHTFVSRYLQQLTPRMNDFFAHYLKK